MPECQNCGSHVTESYARVFTPNHVDEPRCCPECKDKIRENGKVRDARAHRGGDSSDPIQYDTEMMADGGQS